MTVHGGWLVDVDVLVTGQMPLPLDVDDAPAVCPDCYEDDHCGDDRCWCCEESDGWPLDGAALDVTTFRRVVTLRPLERYL